MAPRRNAPVDPQLLRRLHNRVERRQPKPKTKRPPGYYESLKTKHDDPTTVIKNQYAPETECNLDVIRGKFERFCHDEQLGDWRSVIKNCSRGTMISFTQHMYDKGRVSKRGAMTQYRAQFGMLYNKENGRLIDTNDRKEVLKYVDTLPLDRTVKSKPVLGVDDLLLLLNCHWARDKSVYRTERQRVQYALILLLLFGTGCRPAELVDAKRKRRDNPGSNDEDLEGDVDMGGVEGDTRLYDALCYEDVRLLVVHEPDNSVRDVLAMEVKLSHHKGHNKRPKPTIFFFTEVDDPIFCAITHFVSLALADEAFEAPSLTTPKRVFEHKIRGPVNCTELHWKEEMLKTPIFRRDDSEAALPYNQLRDPLNRLGKIAGIKEKLTSYCFRRGTANVVDHAATDAVRDQVMRHNANSALYNGHYANEKVRFDVQSAGLGRPSVDGVLRMLTHMSLMCDPRAPVHVPDEYLAALPPDPVITALEQEREQLKAGAYRIQGTSIEAEVRRLTAAIGSARTKRRNIISQEFRDDYFRRRPTEDIERHNNGQHEEEYVEPLVEHQIPQRTQLVDLICPRVTDITPQNAVKRRIQVAELMLAICKCREVPSRYRLRVGIPPPSIFKEESPELGPLNSIFPLECSKKQCPFCIGDESKSYEQRMGEFCRPATMMNHVENIHLKGRDPKAKIECCHPTCKSQGLVLEKLEYFKSHVELVHKITLRE
ncbi:hypothetical protein V500_03919 [Pseudogymnoascus sp. VKM F-4518 (FW-2643)]|nr:hypothetical protein V500_03919 [Pseudogymnoascus sp. VKM F-4518 (FW-2643)]